MFVYRRETRQFQAKKILAPNRFSDFYKLSQFCPWDFTGRSARVEAARVQFLHPTDSSESRSINSRLDIRAMDVVFQFASEISIGDDAHLSDDCNLD